MTGPWWLLAAVGFSAVMVFVGLWWASRDTLDRPVPKDDTPQPLPPNKTLAEFFVNTDEHGQEKAPG